MLRIVSLALLIAASQSMAAEPAKVPAEKQLVRPVLWWSDINRTSDGGGGGIKPTTAIIVDAKEFAAQWNRLKMKGPVPKVDFREHFVLVLLRVDGLDFGESGGLTKPATIDGGLKVDTKGDATPFGLPAFMTSTNAGWWSTTIAIFPRKGITTVEGLKFPDAEKRSALPDGKTIDSFDMGSKDLVGPANLSITRDGKVSYKYMPMSELSLGRQPMMHTKNWEIPAKEAAALLDGLVADGLLDLKNDEPHVFNRTLTARTGQWSCTVQTKELPAKIGERLAPLIRQALPDLEKGKSPRK